MPSWAHQAATLAGRIVSERAVAGISLTVDLVGDAVGLFCRRTFYKDKVQPLRQSIDAIERAQPLDERSIREAAGTLGRKPSA